MNLEIRKYAFWPNVPKMKANSGDNYDYIGLCFELSFKNSEIDDKTERNAYLFSYIFIDKHDKDINVSFEIAGSDDDTNEYYSQRIMVEKVKATKQKTVQIPNDLDKINMKPILIECEAARHHNTDAILKDFLEKDVLTDILKIKPFLNNNKIDYDTKELNDYIKKLTTSASQFFSTAHLNTELHDEIKSVDTLLRFNGLNANLDNKDLKTNSNKMKI